MKTVYEVLGGLFLWYIAYTFIVIDETDFLYDGDARIVLSAFISSTMMEMRWWVRPLTFSAITGTLFGIEVAWWTIFFLSGYQLSYHVLAIVRKFESISGAEMFSRLLALVFGVVGAWFMTLCIDSIHTMIYFSITHPSEPFSVWYIPFLSLIIILDFAVSFAYARKSKKPV